MISDSRVTLGEVVDDLTTERAFTAQVGEPLVDPTISTARHVISPSRIVGVEQKVRRRVRILPGDLVFSRLHTQNGAFAFADQEYQATTTFIPLRVHEHRVDRRYLFWALHHCIGGLSTLDTVGRETYKAGDILQLTLPLPAKEEQHRIGRQLDELSAVIDARKSTSKLAGSLVDAIFHKEFGSPITNDRSHPRATLAELATIVTGNTPPRSSPWLYGENIEWVKTSNIDPVRGAVSLASERLSEEGASQGRIVPAGSVLITCIAGGIERIGDAAIVDRPVAINQQINALVPRSDVSSTLLLHLVRSLRGVIQGRAAGLMTRIINKGSLSAVEGVLPDAVSRKGFERRADAAHSAHLELLEGTSALEKLFESLVVTRFGAHR